MHCPATFFSILGLVASVTAQGSYGGDQSSCSAAQAFTYMGCYPAGSNGPHAGFNWQLSSSTTNEKYYPGFTGSANLTVEQCQTACRGHNFRYAGLWYGTDCWCSASFPSLQASTTGSSTGGPGPPVGSSPGTTGTGCSSQCGGNTTEYCGGGGATSIYQDPSYTYPSSVTAWQNYLYLGCYNNVNPGPSFQVIRTNGTVNCATYCGQLGYAYMSRSAIDSNTASTSCGCGSEVQSGLQIAESNCFNYCNGTAGAKYVTPCYIR